MDPLKPKDAPKTFTVEDKIQFQDGIERDIIVTIQREDPFGFLYLTSNQGKLPEDYSGRYTTIEYATHAAKQYIEGLKKMNTKITGSTEGTPETTYVTPAPATDGTQLVDTPPAEKPVTELVEEKKSEEKKTTKAKAK